MDEKIGNNFSDKDVLKYLKLSGEINRVFDNLVIQKKAKEHFTKTGDSISTELLQESCDQFRRLYGLTRAQDMFSWLKTQNLSVDDFEAFIENQLMVEKIKSQLSSNEKVENYFNQNKSQFDSAVLYRILLDEEGKASLVYSEIEDEGEDFRETAQKYSLDKTTAANGGYIGEFFRYQLADDEALSANPGDLIGPLQTPIGYEIIMVSEINRAESLTDTLCDLIGKKLFDEWLSS